ncbi:MAG TPA: NUDIX domain-containing protein [Candidatus Paceibacterota bacterium]
MQRIITAGIIIFRKSREGIKFLILYHRGNYWNFPKGHVESEEKSWQAALREVREETGLKPSELKFVEGFKAYERFVYHQGKNKAFKLVILYLAETRQPRIAVSEEHNGYGWFTYQDARRILSKHHESVKILEKAYDYLRPKSVRRGSAHPPRPHAHVQRSGSVGGQV